MQIYAYDWIAFSAQDIHRFMLHVGVVIADAPSLHTVYFILHINLHFEY